MSSEFRRVCYRINILGSQLSPSSIWHMPVLTNAVSEIQVGGLGQFSENFGSVATPKTPCLKHGLDFYRQDSTMPKKMIEKHLQKRSGVRSQKCEQQVSSTAGGRWQLKTELD